MPMPLHQDDIDLILRSLPPKEEFIVAAVNGWQQAPMTMA